MFSKKLLGDNLPLPARASYKSIALTWLGSTLAIALLLGLEYSSSYALIFAAFGASCMLVFGYPDVPFAQPRNVIFGHFLSCLVGLVFLSVFGPHWWSMAIAVGTANALMLLTRTTHPPAGGNPIAMFLIQPSWWFLFFPVLLGTVVLIGFALIYNNLVRDGKYPKYW